jgi:hypothetical protein
LVTLLNKHFIKYKRPIFFLVCLIPFFSCNITKHLKENEYLVSSNKIIDHQKSKVAKDEVETYIRQKPNRKLLFVFPFNLWLYNQVDKDKLARKKEKRDARFGRVYST